MQADISINNNFSFKPTFYLLLSGFVAGLFSIASQAIIFREYTSIFGGNELAIACFFSTWLLWVAAGGFIGRLISNIHWINSHLEILLMLYPCLLVIQLLLILFSHRILAIRGFEIIPVSKLFLSSLYINSPVSLLTGSLFTVLCSSTTNHLAKPVSVIYAIETFGGALGGILITYAFMSGLDHGTVISIICAIIVLTCGLISFLFKKTTSCIAFFLIMVIFLLPRTWRWIEKEINLKVWSKNLPPETFIGAIYTPQSRYLYGIMNNQLVLQTGNSIIETFPENENSAATTAAIIAQKPDAKKIIIIGNSEINIAKKFLLLPSVEKIIWLSCDPDYPARILKILKENFQIELENNKFIMPAMDPYRWLVQSKEYYDIIFIDIPSPTTLFINRFVTENFIKLASLKLTQNGLLTISVTGGENFLGTELVYYGASIYRILTRIFKNIAIKPGEYSLLFASNGIELSEDPILLIERFSSIADSSMLYPSQRLTTLYLQDRSIFQKNCYIKAISAVPEEAISNTENSPRSLLYALMASIKKAGIEIQTDFIWNITSSPVVIFTVPLLIYLLLRILYLFSYGTKSSVFNRYDLIILQGITGAVAMGSSEALMIKLQNIYGALYLYVGMMSSLFMVGTTAGTYTSRLLYKSPRILPLVLIAICHILLLFFLAIIPTHTINIPTFSLAFFFLGFASGLYIPFISNNLAATGYNSTETGTIVEVMDHAGGVIGALIIGFIWIPFAGPNKTLALLSVLLFISLPIMIKRQPLKFHSNIERFLLLAIYLTAWLATTALTIKHIAVSTKVTNSENSLENITRLLYPNAIIKEKNLTVDNTKYLEITSADNQKLYAIKSIDFAREIKGYGGHINLAIIFNSNGIIDKIKIISSSETPEYFFKIPSWLECFTGVNPMNDQEIKKIQSVTGATISSEAIKQSVIKSIRTFLEKINNSAAEKIKVTSESTNIALILLCFIIPSLILRKYPSKILRTCMLIASLCILGLWKNIQYSYLHILMLLHKDISFSSVNILIIGIPLLVILFGNIFCGYICPFGALQALPAHLFPSKITVSVDKRTARWIYLLKYLLFFTITFLSILYGYKTVYRVDPLVFFFSDPRIYIYGLLIIFIISIFVPRLWCKNLCITGAFLNIAGKLKLARFFVPGVIPYLCRYHADSQNDIECFICDECKIFKKPYQKQILSGKLYIIILLLLILSVTYFSLPHKKTSQSHTASQILVKPPETVFESSTLNILPKGARRRDIDKIKEFIKEHKLSDHEAKFYRKIKEE